MFCYFKVSATRPQLMPFSFIQSGPKRNEFINTNCALSNKYMAMEYIFRNLLIYTYLLMISSFKRTVSV